MPIDLKLNQRVTLEIPDADPPVRYTSRIEAVESDALLLAAPTVRLTPVPIQPGVSLRVTLFHNGGAHAFTTQVRDRDMVPMPVLRVELPERLEALQRRQYFRQPATVRTLCRTRDTVHALVAGLTRNLGGGGICLRTRDIEAASNLLASTANHEPVWVEVVLPDRPIAALAVLAWSRSDLEEGYIDLGLDFVDLSDSERERLIRFLFVLQREALRKGS